MEEELIAEIQREHITEMIRRGQRQDGRNLNEERDIQIETNLIKKAEGSARVKLGETEVVVGIKMETGDPFPDTPNQGVLITNAELNALASPTFEPGPPGEYATEIARVVDRGIRESQAIDFTKLSITEGEKVWMIFVDIHVLDHDGNLFDVSNIAAISALLTTDIPYEKYEVEPGTNEIDIKTIPVSKTYLKCGNEILLDPTHNEEMIGTTRLTTITNSENEIVGMQKGQSGTWTEQEIYNIVDKSIEKAQKTRKIIKNNITKR
ncbi:Exosome complex RNA-binding protein Rrp42 RNase PH superfamily [Methanonatronarchaeum thermophilum]|uniref:Exosome complex component Rrp42 n=1 Tax=Methanonatronarchaeum thermophilum TaxID=1927129 RepID=A0A1Y3GE90_9EURY|nr:exosome complex protein Rrp42 [Methanonatronarchaeum thermophilum]OUJ19527.1 Exosome complex RNA-binding protein Rrp42 RNase PH superfamily [Methanonatronarchaeum thermophilum]